MKACDYLVIGGGVIGISVSIELSKRYPNSKIIVIEKEDGEAKHASGRNSGVLHAGFYYTEDSLKAKFTRDGNAALTKYCDDNNLPIRKCGKLVVAQSNEDISVLDKLLDRAAKNNVELEKITENEAKQIEPKVKTMQYALFSPTTSTVDPKLIVKKMSEDSMDAGVVFHFNTAYKGCVDGVVKTSNGQIDAKYVINSAGLYADKIAKDYGFSKNYYLLPFKGIYLRSSDIKSNISTNIYPVPNLENPFLGVHFTLTVDGVVKIGPTAIPAFWVEQYNGLENFNINEFKEIVKRQLSLFTKSDFDFKRLAFEEVLKYYKPNMIKKASRLCNGFNNKIFDEWSIPGIRAQLIDARKNKLEMDFVIEGDDKSIHILNAVSPAFTCSIPFSKYVVDCIESLVLKK